MATKDRVLLLEEAIKITSVDRNQAYGNPEDNFNNIANMWRAHLKARYGVELVDAADVAIMMILMKAARLSTNPTHRDSAVDVAGYSACLHDIQLTMSEKGEANETNTQRTHT